jgi:hypothetical protein
MPQIQTSLANLQAEENSYVGIKVASFIMIIIIALIVLVKTFYFNSKRKPTEPVEYSYQKIAMIAIAAAIFIHFFIRIIF